MMVLQLIATVHVTWHSFEQARVGLADIHADLVSVLGESSCLLRHTLMRCLL
jgi:hypothetical protein